MRILIETEGVQGPAVHAPPSVVTAALDGGASALNPQPAGEGGLTAHAAASTSPALDGGPVADWLVQAIQDSRAG